MIASPIYHQKRGQRKAATFLTYVTQRSLAIAMFVALAVLASIGNKPSGKTNLGLTSSVSQPGNQQSYLALNPPQLFDNIVRSVKDAFNDPALVQYANDHAAMGSPTLTMPTHSGNRGAQNFGNKCAVDR
jgi:hypothetical protein